MLVDSEAEGDDGGRSRWTTGFKTPELFPPAREEKEEVIVCLLRTCVRGDKTHRTVSRANSCYTFVIGTLKKYSVGCPELIVSSLLIVSPVCFDFQFKI